MKAARVDEPDFSSGPFSPRGLVINGLLLHAVLAAALWQQSAVTVLFWWLTIRSEPRVAVIASLLVAAFVALLLTAWRRQTYAWCGSFLAFCLVLLPWPFSFYLFVSAQ